MAMRCLASALPNHRAIESCEGGTILLWLLITHGNGIVGWKVPSSRLPFLHLTLNIPTASQVTSYPTEQQRHVVLQICNPVHSRAILLGVQKADITHLTKSTIDVLIRDQGPDHVSTFPAVLSYSVIHDNPHPHNGYNRDRRLTGMETSISEPNCRLIIRSAWTMRIPSSESPDLRRHRRTLALMAHLSLYLTSRLPRPWMILVND